MAFRVVGVACCLFASLRKISVDFAQVTQRLVTRRRLETRARPQRRRLLLASRLTRCRRDARLLDRLPLGGHLLLLDGHLLARTLLARRRSEDVVRRFLLAGLTNLFDALVDHLDRRALALDLVVVVLNLSGLAMPSTLRIAHPLPGFVPLLLEVLEFGVEDRTVRAQLVLVELRDVLPVATNDILGLRGTTLPTRE